VATKAELEARVRELEGMVAERDARIAALEARLAALEALLGRTSTNSSLPPSKNPPHAKPSRKNRPSGKPAGGQQGHPPHLFAPVSEDDISRTVECAHATRCDYCRADLADAPVVLGEPATPFFAFDLPPLALDVTAYLRPRRQCDHCERHTVAPLPAGVGPSPFGPGLVAFIASLTVRYRLGRRPVSDLLAELFGRRISVGAIQSALELASEAVAAAVAALQASLDHAPVVNLDETGWRDQSGFAQGKRCGLWVARSPAGTLFAIAPGRDVAGSLRVLGEGFTGHVICDRWRPYETRFGDRRQLCWPHIDREATAAVDRGRLLAKREDPAVAARGEALVAWGTAFGGHIDRLFHHWHAFCEGTISRKGLRGAITAVREGVARVLAEGVRLADKQVAGTCRDLLRQYKCLWTFVTVEGVEPTNNGAERAIRPAVILRGLMLSTKSEAGRVLFGRLMSVVATCRQQGRNALAYLRLALERHALALPPPPLIPI
jgi:transposase